MLRIILLGAMMVLAGCRCDDARTVEFKYNGKLKSCELGNHIYHDRGGARISCQNGERYFVQEYRLYPR